MAKLTKYQKAAKLLTKLADEEANKGSFYQCFHCGAYAVGWSGDFSFEDYGMEGEGVINCCHCSNCGADIEYYVSCEDKDDQS